MSQIIQENNSQGSNQAQESDPEMKKQQYSFIKSDTQVERKGKKLTIHSFYKNQTDRYLDGLKSKKSNDTSDIMNNSFQAPNNLEQEYEQNKDQEIFIRKNDRKQSTKQFYQKNVMKMLEKFATKKENGQTVIDNNNSNQTNQNDINYSEKRDEESQIYMNNSLYQESIKLIELKKNLEMMESKQSHLIQLTNDDILQLQNQSIKQETQQQSISVFFDSNTNSKVSAMKGNRRNQSIQKQQPKVQFPFIEQNNQNQENTQNLIIGQNDEIKLDLSKLNAINRMEKKRRQNETQSANSKRSIRSNWTSKTFKEKAEEVAVPAVGTAIVGSLGVMLAKNVLKGKQQLLGIIPALACSAYYYYKVKKQNEVEMDFEDEEDVNSEEEQDSTRLEQ
ncbi:unnamed protein product (macronuclear) [Paramecium tetraurelia]|uniref:Transmembrane protein n=1 Tax=Paramecium tetraurelia TaxID=5888 RepID=A0C4K5_PARTE|nr:uncharacterized protein GSPATT00006221001 [Paramecium tetraurelia]CAK65722.1 unnamed protein product [Paramecium tetraurelia]|eukprot:XP_001433119.1 hypothetical protein (macronuclear) [Paramecium tetraurelia strain d4-2]